MIYECIYHYFLSLHLHCTSSGTERKVFPTSPPAILGWYTNGSPVCASGVGWIRAARGVKTSVFECRRELFDGKCSYPTQSLSNNRKFINFLYKNEILRRKLENLLPRVESRKIFPHSNCVLTLLESHFLIARCLPQYRSVPPEPPSYTGERTNERTNDREESLHPNPCAIILFLLIFHAKERMKPGSVGSCPNVHWRSKAFLWGGGGGHSKEVKKLEGQGPTIGQQQSSFIF